jgi:hypothetical protein
LGIVWRDVSNPRHYQEWLSTGTESPNDWLASANGFKQHYPGIFTHPPVDLTIDDDGVVDWDATRSNYFRLELTAHVTAIALSNIPVGADITLFLGQDAVGFWDIAAWPETIHWLGDAPSIPNQTSIDRVFRFVSYNDQFLIGYPVEGISSNTNLNLIGAGPKPVTVPGHNFAVGTVLYLDEDGNYRKALSNSQHTIGRYMVAEVVNPNTVTLAQWMQVVPIVDLIPGAWYQVSPTVPGAIVPGSPTKPPEGGTIVNLMGQADEHGTGLIFQNPIAFTAS